ncbi:hypothetical protein [Rosenbergiella collisarenosi]|uniref:hypothetical protein n=1 Tax=Rosenbergiella collisarenosi TaxID=1544695 RepID=UPI001F4FD545|nr:hypothetical protein [Rosenbergiella collisarenosi]
MGTLHNHPSSLKKINHDNTPDIVKSGGGHGGGGGDDMFEKRVGRLESDVDYIKRDINELKSDAKEISKNIIIALSKLDNIQESLSKKPSTDSVDKKISDAKLAILLGVPTIIGIATALYKLVSHFV